MTGWFPVFRRELGGYFATPVAYVFLIIFLILAGISTFQLGNFLTSICNTRNGSTCVGIFTGRTNFGSLRPSHAEHEKLDAALMA